MCLSTEVYLIYTLRTCFIGSFFEILCDQKQRNNFEALFFSLVSQMMAEYGGDLKILSLEITAHQRIFRTHCRKSEVLVNVTKSTVCSVSPFYDAGLFLYPLKI